MQPEAIDDMIRILKEIKQEDKRFRRLGIQASSRDLTPKRICKLDIDVNYSRHQIHLLEHGLHCLIVENDLAKPYEDSYYGDKVWYPDAFHTQGMAYHLRRPNNR